MRSWSTLAAEFERTATARGRESVGGFAVEGLRLIERALAASAELRGILAADSFGQVKGSRESILVDRVAERGVPLLRTTETELTRLMNGRGGGAIVGVVGFPPKKALAEVLAASKTVHQVVPTEPTGQSTPLNVLVGIDIEDPGNVGALVRTALAGGAAAYYRVGSGDPYHPKAVRTSMGSLFRLPLIAEPDGQAWTDDLRRNAFRSLGAVTHDGTSVADIALGDENIAWVVGSEAFGLPADIVRRLDGTVTIPMAGQVDSFSVNAAAAILVYEGNRRRAG